MKECYGVIEPKGILLPTLSHDQMDIEQEQQLQREQDQSREVVSVYYGAIPKPDLSLGHGIQTGLNI